jgi:hypothetical protein
MSRILGLKNKYPEIGRIRAGKKSEGGKQPMEALETWRFTSKDENAIKAIAGTYGGSPHPWTDRDGEWEVFSQSDSLSVQLPGDALFVAFEKWGSGGNQRRCDGSDCTIPVQDDQGGHLEVVPCPCADSGLVPGESKEACTVTVRLKVVLPEIPGIGIWMLTSGSIYAAMELPAQVDLLDALRQRSGILIPCELELQYREEKRAYERFKRKYRVPTLRVSGSIQSIMQLHAQANTPPSIAPTRATGELAPPTGGQRPALPPNSGESRREPPGGSGEPLLRARTAGKKIPPS